MRAESVAPAATATVDTDALIAQWRAQRADLVAPIAFQRIVALQRRAAQHHGGIRRTLDARLATLVQDYTTTLQQAGDKPSAMPVATALRDLLDGFGQRAQARARAQAGHGNPAAGDDARGNDSAAASMPTMMAPTMTTADLPALQDVRKLWARVRTDSQVERSLARSPTNAGPLNSSRLVHRSLTLMHALSPEYLEQFLSYVDAMSWLEQLNDGGVLAAKDAPQTDIGLPRARSKPRKRRK